MKSLRHKTKRNIDAKITLNCILEKYGVKVYTLLYRLRIVSKVNNSDFKLGDILQCVAHFKNTVRKYY